MPANRSLLATLVLLAPLACGDAGAGESGGLTGTDTSTQTAGPTTTGQPPTGTTGTTGPDSDSSATAVVTLTTPTDATDDPPTATGDPTGASDTSDTSDTSDPADTDTTGGPAGCEPALPSFADGKLPATTLYVTAGAAPGGDGSEAEPFAALAAALAVAGPGTEVRVSGDLPAPTYQVGLTGSADAPIWISGAPGAKIGPLTLQTASHIIVQDLEIAGSPEGHVLHFFDADHIMMRRLQIHDAGLGCIKGSQTTHAYVEDSDLWSAGKFNAHPVLDFVGVNTGHIVRSKFHDGPGVMIMLKGGTSDLLFAWNEVFDQTAPGNALDLGQDTLPIYFQPIDAEFEGLRLVAFANLLHGLVGAPVAFEGCKDCAAVRNTIWDCTGNQLVRFLPGAAGAESGATTSISEGCRFTGNIVVGGVEGGASLNADAPNTGPNNVLDHNVFLKPGAINWWGVIPQDMVHSTYDQDPQLGADGKPGNLALVDGKGPPDLDGLPFAEAFVQDAAGACIGGPPDIGAFEVP